MTDKYFEREREIMKAADPYRWVAAELFKTPIDEVTDAQRTAAKQTLFASFYSGTMLHEALWHRALFNAGLRPTPE